jgi:hypothetical protein
MKKASTIPSDRTATLLYTSNMRRAALFVVVGVVVFGATTLRVHAGLPCDNPTPATQAQVDASNGGLTLGQLTCPDLSQLGITGDAGAAKAYLLSIAKDLRNSAAPPDKAHIDPLNNSFAICAANFLKAYKDAYGPVYVVSAFRCGPNSPSNISCDRSENGRAGGATNSNHQLGTAMDINPAGGNSSYDTLKSFAQANPGYGVTFPQPFYNGSIDKNHMQATNPRNPSCTGVSGTPVTPGNGLPFNNNIRQALGMQPAPPPPPAAPVQSAPVATPVTTPTSPTTAIPNVPPLGTVNTTPYPAGTCTPQSFCNQQDGNIYYRATTCVDQVYQQCSKGCSGQICNATSTSSSTGGSTDSGVNITNNNDNSNSNTNSNTAGTSTFDLIDFFANGGGISAAPIGTATPIDINEAIQSGDNTSVLAPTSTSMGIIQTPPQGSRGIVYLTPQQQTFISPNQQSSGYYGNFTQSTFQQQILAGMKAALLAMLPYLQPFGTTMNGQVQI